ncbi:putative selenate reductase subunit YgfK [Heliobacterium mobile]|uniref:putative selenate reductase subunit YgfK n=1 Tax=Heliobacterium mobile TaxID=28064 RepID=UPI001F241981|nr:putative selenate reductase subunit YgfK [Heliobacterium mobile]
MSLGDMMRPIPFRELLQRIFEEYATERSIFSLPEESFFRKKGTKQVRFFGEPCETAVGPAAGPHTQLAQNIVTSYLAGSRFIELKTVQEKEPPVAKPCIDAEDEGFNTEWSSEFTVEKAYEEYIKAWVALYLIEEIFALRASDERSFLFNMSVGYNMEGICSPRMNRYIDDLRDASDHPCFIRCLNELDSIIKDDSFFAGTGLEGRLPEIQSLPERISPKVCKSVTLSTMHGCPPAEIEKICAYMITEKKMETYVKLNPTLLTFPVVRQILDNLGFDYVELAQESFDHDLQYTDAVPMLHRLKRLAQDHGRFFGVKLTNTLGSVNFKGRLPGGEMYMSGRALFPISINLAAKISKEFSGEMPISFSGGINEHNIVDVFQTGIKPITVATDLLKPGGYGRLVAMAAKLEDLGGWDRARIDVDKLSALAEKALQADFTQKQYRGTAKATINGTLPLFDCAEAPCKTACPIHQDIPEYIRLVGEKRYAEALALIYEKNALPSITGHICDHACQYHCTRMDYEGCVLIREMKRIAVKQGFAEYREKWAVPAKKHAAKVAVMGAGPAGLASAYFLAREGFDVTVFEPRQSAGGTVRHVIPRFRISDEAIESDIQFIKDHGVKFHFGADRSLTPEALKGQGFSYVIVAVGAGAEKDFLLENASSSVRIISALEFLQRYNSEPASLQLGKHVAIVGAGNTAMDASRTALKLPGVESSTVIYRRTEKEMPAYREEYELALADKVKFHFLLNPESFDADGTLRCRVMKLGQRDSSGRRKPEKTEELRTLPIDTLITAIGEDVDYALLHRLGLTASDKMPPETNKLNCETVLQGVYLVGDAHRGPSSIVNGIADGRKAADAICRIEDPAWQPSRFTPSPTSAEQVKRIASKKQGLTAQSDVPVEAGDEVNLAVGDKEYHRCVECNSVCNKCVEVCPNRANVAVPMSDEGRFRNYYQIVHIDAYCNECGNCASFCPWEGRPYTDKPTLFSLRNDFEDSRNPGFFVEGDQVLVRLNGEVHTFALADGTFAADSCDGEWSKLSQLFAKLYQNRPSLFGHVDE